ncbi:hypothetical protein [Actinoplanes sp. NPDC026670]|uniref:hypothetical protein n=1 Tax=Actinoplanes sp. NPDC026670 TaxID=3154700 RepID=UPI0033C799B6
MSRTRELFERFRTEVRDDTAWDSEFTPSPYHPEGKLIEFLDGVPLAETVPLLLDALADPELGFWACSGLERVGPEAGGTAVTALTELIVARREPLGMAAAALDAIAPERARELGVHRLPEVMPFMIGRYVSAGVTATAGYLEWFVATQADDDVVRLFGDVRIHRRLVHDCPPPLAALLLGLIRGGRGVPLRRVAAEFLALSGAAGVTGELIGALSVGGPLPPLVVERVAAHPASEALVPRLIDRPGHADGLGRLVARRRCAGLGTDPAQLRAFLTDSRDSGVATVIAELRDESMLVHLLPFLGVPREHEAALRAVSSFGDRGRVLLAEDQRRELDAYERYRTPDFWLGSGDREFVQGRIEPYAFAAYGDALLLRPSAHAAFQLAWIDRAFGVPITADRVDWIRALGFTDEAFLTELAEPVRRPLDGPRFVWERRDDPARKEAAGLPPAEAAKVHLERVGQAVRTVPPADFGFVSGS